MNRLFPRPSSLVLIALILTGCAEGRRHLAHHRHSGWRIRYPPGLHRHQPERHRGKRQRDSGGGGGVCRGSGISGGERNLQPAARTAALDWCASLRVARSMVLVRDGAVARSPALARAVRSRTACRRDLTAGCARRPRGAAGLVGHAREGASGAGGARPVVGRASLGGDRSARSAGGPGRAAGLVGRWGEGASSAGRTASVGGRGLSGPCRGTGSTVRPTRTAGRPVSSQHECRAAPHRRRPLALNDRAVEHRSKTRSERFRRSRGASSCSHSRSRTVRRRRLGLLHAGHGAADRSRALQLAETKHRQGWPDYIRSPVRSILAAVLLLSGCEGPEAPDAAVCRDVITRLCLGPVCGVVEAQLRVDAMTCEATLTARTGCGSDAFGFAAPSRAQFLDCRVPLLRQGSSTRVKSSCDDVAQAFTACPELVTFFGGQR